MQMSDRAAGCLFGLAIGDALGAPTEFIRHVGAIRREFPPDGPREPYGNPALVTDDTQMALAVAEALADAPRPFSAATLEPRLRDAFVRWLHDPDNDRAPGMTCLTACRALQDGGPWQQATVQGSKGCGANMRVPPVGLLLAESDETRACIAQLQAALTHGHPTALAASDLNAWTVTYLARGGDPGELPTALREYARSQRAIYHAAWLGDLWQRPGIGSPEEFIGRGWDECAQVLDRLDNALKGSREIDDPCALTGEGWIAEEALGTALLCYLLTPEDGVTVVRRAAVTSGDSDSIACLAGAFAGAYLGLATWPEEWVYRIEYRERLAQAARALESTSS